MINPTTAQNMHQFYQDNPDEDPVYTKRSGPPVIKDGDLTIQNSSELARSVEAAIIDDKKTSLAKEEGLAVQVGSPEPEFVAPKNSRNFLGPEDRDLFSKYQRADDQRSLWEKNSGMTDNHVADQGGHPMHTPVTTSPQATVQTSATATTTTATPSVAAATTTASNAAHQTTQASSQPAQAIADQGMDPQVQAQLQALRAVAQDENASVKDRRAARREIRAIRGGSAGDAPQNASMPSSGITAEDRAKIQDLRDVARNQDNPTKVRRQARQELKQIRRDALSGNGTSDTGDASVRSQIQDLRDIARDESMPTSERRQARQQIKELRRTIASGSDGLQTQASSMPASASAPQGYKEKHASIQRQVQQTRRDAKERYGSLSREQLEAIVDPNTIQPATPGKAPFDYQLRQKAIQNDVQQARQAARAQVNGATTNPGAAAMPVQGEAMNQGVNAQIQDLRDVARNDENSTIERRQARQQIKALKRAKNAGMQEQANENIPVRQPVQGERFDDTPQEQIQRLRGIAQSDKSTVKERRQARQEIRALRREQQANRVASMQGETTQASSMPSQAQSAPNETRSSSQAPAGAPSPQGVGSNMTVAASATGSIAANPSAPSVNNGSPAATYAPSTGGYSKSSSGSIGDTAAVRSGYGAPRTRADLTAPRQLSKQVGEPEPAAPRYNDYVNAGGSSPYVGPYSSAGSSTPSPQASPTRRSGSPSQGGDSTPQQAGRYNDYVNAGSDSPYTGPYSYAGNNAAASSTPRNREDIQGGGTAASVGGTSSALTGADTMDRRIAGNQESMKVHPNEIPSADDPIGVRFTEWLAEDGSPGARIADNMRADQGGVSDAFKWDTYDPNRRDLPAAQTKSEKAGDFLYDEFVDVNPLNARYLNPVTGPLKAANKISDGITGLFSGDDDEVGFEGGSSSRWSDGGFDNGSSASWQDTAAATGRGSGRRPRGAGGNRLNSQSLPQSNPADLNVQSDIRPRASGASAVGLSKQGQAQQQNVSGSTSSRAMFEQNTASAAPQRSLDNRLKELSQENLRKTGNSGGSTGSTSSRAMFEQNTASAAPQRSFDSRVKEIRQDNLRKIGNSGGSTPGSTNSKFDVGANVSNSGSEVEAKFSHSNTSRQGTVAGGGKPGDNAMSTPQVEVSSTTLRRTPSANNSRAMFEQNTATPSPQRSFDSRVKEIREDNLRKIGNSGGNAAESGNALPSASPSTPAVPKYKIRQQRRWLKNQRRARKEGRAAAKAERQREALASASPNVNSSANKSQPSTTKKQSFFKKINDVPRSGGVVNAADSALAGPKIIPASPSKGFGIGGGGKYQ